MNTPPAPQDPTPPEPDTKDWTWVLERRCPECGFDGPNVAATDVGHELIALVEPWRHLLVVAGDRVDERWEERTWSALEYACHVRDACEVYEQRLERMLTEDDPHYANWDQDATAVQRRYHEADPVLVASQLTTAAKRLAARFRAVRTDQWARPGQRGDGASFTVATFAVYFLHDPYHHLHDVRQGLAGLGLTI